MTKIPAASFNNEIYNPDTSFSTITHLNVKFTNRGRCSQQHEPKNGDGKRSIANEGYPQIDTTCFVYIRSLMFWLYSLYCNAMYAEILRRWVNTTSTDCICKLHALCTKLAITDITEAVQKVKGGSIWSQEVRSWPPVAHWPKCLNLRFKWPQTVMIVVKTECLSYNYGQNCIHFFKLWDSLAADKYDQIFHYACRQNSVDPPLEIYIYATLHQRPNRCMVAWLFT